MKMKEDAERERKRAEELEKENEKLRNEVFQQRYRPNPASLFEIVLTNLAGGKGSTKGAKDT